MARPTLSVRLRKSNLFWLGLCIAALPLRAQVITNGDCENNTAGTCQYNLGNAAFNGMMPGYTAYGGGNEMDIQLNGCNYGTVTPNGQYFISLANSSFGNPGDEIAVDVVPPFLAGNTYTITWLEQANTQFRPLDTLEIGISNVLGNFGTRISATQPPDNVWMARCITFTATTDCGYVTVRNKAPNEAWNFIDNLAVSNATFNFINDTTICAGTSVVLDATTPGSTYLWSDGSTNATLTVSLGGTYWVQVDNGACAFTDTVVVTAASTLSAALGNDTTMCNGQSLLLDASIPGGSYLWSDGTTGSSITVTGAGSYWVEVQVASCVYTDTVAVSFVPAPVADIGNDTTLCAGSTLLLDATSAGSSYQWQNGSSASTFNVTSAGVHWVTLTAGGCSDTDSVTINYYPVIPVDLGNDSTLCIGGTLVLDATVAGASYVWSDSTTGSTLTVDSDGIYSVVVSLNGCTNSDAITVTFVAPPTPDLGIDTAICPYDSLLLSANAPGSNLLWSDGSNGATLFALPAAVYWVDADNGTCVVRDSMTLSSVVLPTVDLGPDTAICEGELVVLDATFPSATYEWQDGSTAPFFVADQTGMYAVQITADGCSSTDSMALDVGLPATVDLGNDSLLCPGYKVLLFADAPGASFLWSTGETTSAVVASRPGTFTVQVTLGPCLTSDTIVLRFNDIDCDCPLYAPNAMTSDGDGINDSFAPYMPCPSEEWELLVFNRWGQAIFRTTDQFEQWEGATSGTTVPDGVYIWQLSYRPLHSSEGRLKRGHVTVLH